MQDFLRCRQNHLDFHKSEQLTKFDGEFDAGAWAPMLADATGGRLHVGCVGSPLRLGQGERAAPLHARQGGQPALLLFLRAKRSD